MVAERMLFGTGRRPQAPYPSRHGGRAAAPVAPARDEGGFYLKTNIWLTKKPHSRARPAASDRTYSGAMRDRDGALTFQRHDN